MQIVKNQQITKNTQCRENKFGMVIYWQMGKTSRKAKTPPDDVKVTTLKNPLIKNQAVTSIRNLTTTLAYLEVLAYNWTFTLILNWTWSCSSFFFPLKYKYSICD